MSVDGQRRGAGEFVFEMDRAVRIMRCDGQSVSSGGRGGTVNHTSMHERRRSVRPVSSDDAELVEPGWPLGSLCS